MLKIFGDLHMSRNLPYTGLDNGEDIRYKFRRNLLEGVFDCPAIFLGDITHKRNMIDGKIMKDMYQIFKDKDAYILLGNHDRSADGQKYVSLAENLAEIIEGVNIVTGTKILNIENFALVLTSYYADEEEIEEAVKSAINTDKKVLVLGHWNFYSDLYKSGKKLKLFAKAHPEVKWILGHEHNPQKHDWGFYLGVISPVKFRERQGKYMVIDDGVTFKDYPASEQFIIIEHDQDPFIDYPEHSYVRVETKREELIEKIREHYSDANKLIINLVVEDKEREQVTLSNRTHEDYILMTCDAYEKDKDQIMEDHQRVKEEVENEG